MPDPMVQVPESWVPVFHATSLPGHPDNPGTDNVIEWPRSPSGLSYMPMGGRFIVRNEHGDRPCEDGFIVLGPDGGHYWQAEEPA